MTNLDKVRKLNAEKFYEFQSMGSCFKCAYRNDGDEDCYDDECEGECTEGQIKWLNSEKDIPFWKEFEWEKGKGYAN